MNSGRSRQSGGSITAAISLFIAVFSSSAAPQKTRPAVNFYDDIKPVLAVHCYKCHGGEERKGGLKLDAAEDASAGGKSGKAAIAPGDGDGSELLRRITSSDPEEQMPPKGPRLTADEIERIRTWIEAGASWPERDVYWAFQPPKPHVPPTPVAGVNRWSRAVIRNAIDLFINERLEAHQINPAPEAEPRTLLRRAYADLLGMPPTPGEAEQFLSDSAPDAYERLVDRLLADPRYGERWARHWLDLARYGESDGYEDDKIRPHAWRYRDYVIRSFNQGKPYDRFVQEQIAGDEIWPGDPDAWIATAFARLGPWDAMSKEPEKQRQDFLNDATDAVGAVFLGVTIGCARCHDHKYDVISQSDYYRIQAFFAGVKRETRDYKSGLGEPAAVTAAYDRDSAALKALKEERDGLFRTARETLENERAAATNNAEAKEKKIPDGAINEKVDAKHPGRRMKLANAIKELEARVRLHAPRVETVFFDQGTVPVTRLLLGGDVGRPGPEVKPGFVRAMAPADAVPDSRTTNPRSELARWLSSTEHPLAARVIINRLWQHHFGAGLVATPSDFGRNGERPTHPELLDWLARDFVGTGWTLKKMHRLMMTSAAYRRSSAHDERASKIDPANKLLWRMNHRRLEGEAIRDTLLAVSGSLNPAMGGPGVYAKLPKGVNVEFPNNDKELSWGSSTPADDHRRSIYLFQRRTLTYPMMEVFDAAPMNQSCALRSQTTVAPQTLALFNGEFARAAAIAFARRLRCEAGANLTAQIRHAFQIAFARQPTSAEQNSVREFLANQSLQRSRTGVLNASSTGEPPYPTDEALIDFCHVLLNSNELIYLD